ncbi:Mitochondrial antiviral-signaling protein [Apaloderma vittatum]|uniref:Mitochondrial antiviral-signaling protein n=1 Tax=Apaloderma vittatum TaxID=57397 RepID=A0A091NHV0_APAVI|nr:Mitochondrial antiviral-signaling protein [Apaloderma vittatum]
MGFAEDKVYDYIMKNLRHFKNIRVASLADSLSCLTDEDRDELHSREETRGSHATVYRFYQHLKCRKDWVLDLIEALRHNNAGHLADELQHVYDSYQPRTSPPRLWVLPRADALPVGSSISAQKPFPGPNPAPGAPLAEQPHQDLPVGDRPPLLPRAATAASTDLDARTPVQEESVSRASIRRGHKGPFWTSVVWCGGPVVGPDPFRGTPSSLSLLLSGAHWLRQQHPVCVDNGRFGNANHLHHGTPGLGLHGSLPRRDAGPAHGPQQLRNQPEEDFYISDDLPPRLEETARSGGPQPIASPPKKQAAPGSDPLLVQQRFDAEQKRIRMSQELGGDGETQMETHAPRDTSSSYSTLVKHPVQEEKLPTGSAGSTHSVLTKEKVVDLLPTAAGSAEGTFRRTASWVSSATTIWAPCGNVERDVEFSKPGVLLSTAEESPRAASRCPSTQRPSSQYPRVSDSLTFRSDPILVSTDGSSPGEVLLRVSSECLAPAAWEDPGGEEAAGASRDSCPPSSWDSTSVGTREVWEDHHSSSRLEAGSDLRDRASPLRNSPVSDSGRGAETSSSEAQVPSRDGSRLPLPYVVPAVGVAVISAVAFLVYARLQK